MSWYVLVDGNNILARSGIADPSVLIGSPEVKTELNKAGSFQFEIYPPHPYYDRLIKMKTKIDVVLNGELIFSGRVLYTQMEMDKKRKVYCEGCLSYLLDSIQESYEFDSRITQFYDMTVHEFLDRLLTRHDKMFITDRLGVLDNFQGALTQIGISEGNTDTTDRLRRALKVYNNETSTSRDTFWIDDDTKLFKLGTVNAEGTADRFKFEIKGHSKTLDMILETLVDSVGGFMQAYRDPEDGWYVLDWKDKFGNENMQPIEWGTNLIELQQDESGVETFTRLYPVGKSSTNSNSTGSDKNITLRETRLYLPVQESVIVYDDELDTHEPGTALTTPKASGFYERNNGAYALSQDDYAIRGKQYYMPVFGNPLMLKVDDVLNYTQVYMGEFSAIGVRMDALGLNGNVDLSDRPRVSAETMHEAGYDEFPSGDYATLYSSTYEFEECCLLVTPINQNGTVLSPTEMDDYVDALLEGSVDQIKKNDESHLVIHYVKTNPAGIHQKVLDIDESCNPSEEGYYEYNSTDKYYFPTEDISVVSGKSYYTSTLDDLADKAHDLSSDWEEAIDTYFPNGATPASLGYYEVKQYGYVLTTDTKPVRNKNYYTLRPEESRSRLEEKYGVIVRSVDFSDVNGVNDEAKQLALYKRAVEYIHKTCTDLPEQITLTAIDLRNLDTSIEQMKIGCDIHIKSKPHAIDRHMKCISIDYYLDSPEKNNYVISSKPTGSDAIPRFTEQAETKKKSGSKGSSESTGGTGGSFGGGGSSPEQTEEEIAVLKNHVFYTAGSESDATATGSYMNLFAKALGMQLDEDGNPIVDIEGNWAWDEVTDASTRRNSIITKLDMLPNSGSLISTINAEYVRIDQSEHPGANPKELGWYIFDSKVDWYQTEDEEVVSGKTYYNAGHRAIENPATAVYQKVTDTDGTNPSEKGWYELNGSTYTVTTDTEPVDGKTYYQKKTPKELRWREQKSEGNYKLTNDTSMNPNTVYYENVNAGKNSVLLTSKVEVTPGSVLIESIHNAYYEEVNDPPQGANPKTNGWYVKDANGNYRKTNDQSVVTGRTYYTRTTGAEGAIEVVPGDVLIKAVNQNADSSITLDADQINFRGAINFDSAQGVTMDVYSVESEHGAFEDLNVQDDEATGTYHSLYGKDIIVEIYDGEEDQSVSGQINFEYDRLDGSTGMFSFDQSATTYYQNGVARAESSGKDSVGMTAGSWANGVFSVSTTGKSPNLTRTTEIDSVELGTPTKASTAGFLNVPVTVRYDDDGTPTSTGYTHNEVLAYSSLLEAGEFTSNSPSGSPYTPSNGKIGFSSVTVNVPSGSSPTISIKTKSSEDAGCGPRSVRPNSSDYTQIFSWVTTTDAKRYYAFAVVLSNGTKKYYYIDRNTLQS